MDRLAFRNGPFCTLKRTVLDAEMDRFGTQNGMYLHPIDY